MLAPTRLLLILPLLALSGASLEAAVPPEITANGVVPTVRIAPRPKLVPVVDATDFVFSQLSTSNELSQTRVGQIVEDDQGFIWFGTQYGLNRYDGYQYKIFTHDPRRPGSLSGAYIHSLFKDRSGTLWVGNDEALDRFDPTTETFRHYKLSDDRAAAPPSVIHISQDSRGTLWLATGDGLFGMDPVSGHRVHFVHSASDPAGLASNNIKFTGVDRDGRFWVVNDKGFDQFDTETGKVRLHVPLRESREMGFHQDRAGNFWITRASGSGLALLDTQNNVLVPITFADPEDSGNPEVPIYAAVEDREGSMWFATGGSGLLRWDRESGRMLRYRHRAGDAQSLTADNVTALFQDREDDIWVGFHATAPNRFAPRNAGFERLPYGPMPPHSQGMVNMVNSLYEARDGTLWVSYMGTLVGADRANGRTVYYGEKERGGSGDVLTMAEDPSGNFWIGTVGRGLARFDIQTGSFAWFTHGEADPNSLSNDVVTRLFVDHTGRLWAATWDGLDLFDPRSKRFITYRPSTESHNQMYLGIAEDARGTLWLATHYSGLHSFDPATGRFQVYQHSGSREGTLGNDRVNAVHVDRQGNVWAGTQEGLSRLDPATGQFNTWTERDGLPGNVVSCILEDDAANLWVSTNKGIAEFEPRRSHFRNFSVADGLPGDDLTGWSSCFRGRTGEMFFGGFSGATAFHPERLVDRVPVPHVVLTGFEIAGAPATIGGNSPLSRTIGLTRQVTLSPDQNNFSVEFSALSFGSPRTNRYRYRLEGLDEPWHEVSADRRIATYTTLPPGHYTLQVTGATARGPWSDPGASLGITILPHWWLTWWFRALSGLLCLAGLWLAYDMRVQKIAQQYDIRMSERSRIARELHDSLLQGFQGLMFCIQAARDVLPQRPTEAAAVLETALERGDRAIAEGRGAVQDLRSSAHVENDLAKTLRELGEEMRAGVSSVPVPVCHVVIEGRRRALDPAVRDEIYRIVREAYRNAFKHAKAARIEAEVAYGAQRLWIRIRDDGIGIDPEVVSRGQRPGHWGLPGMRERASAFGGELTVWSEPGAGTEVELEIPASVAYSRGRRQRSLVVS